jgi:bifunctional DNA-binding transcriptional regulator/antitoxin component of YhaV-PrlF toxin-antitoxin module
MKITNVEAKRVVRIKGKELVVEETRNEKGEKIIVVRALSNAKLAKEDEYWQDDLNNVQKVTMKELNDELRKALMRALKNGL